MLSNQIQSEKCNFNLDSVLDKLLEVKNFSPGKLVQLKESEISFVDWSKLIGIWLETVAKM